MAISLKKIEDGDIPTGAEWMANPDFILTNMINLAFDGATTTSQSNLIIATTSAAVNTDVATFTNAIFDATDSRFMFCEVLDQASTWTESSSSGGSTVVSGDTLTLTATSSGGTPEDAKVISNDTNGVDYKSATADSEVVFRWEIGTASGGDGHAIRISDGSSTVDIVSSTGTVSSNRVNLVFDKSADTVDYYVDGVLDTADIAIGALSAWYIEFEVTNDTNPGPGTTTMNVTYVGYLDGTSGTGTLETSTTTAAASSSEMLINFVSDTDEAGFTLSGSADASTFTTITDEAVSEVSPAGTSIRNRFARALKTTIVDSAINIDQYDLKYGVYYG